MLKKFYDFHFGKQMFYKKYPLIHTVLSFGFIIFWVFAFKSSVLDANNIPSGSMQPTLKVGDFLFVNKMRYSFRIPFTDIELFRMAEPQRGDIVTFLPPTEAGLQGKTLVKRVVGVPGDFLSVKEHEISVMRHNSGAEPIAYRAENLNEKPEHRKVLDDLDCNSCNTSPSEYSLYHEHIINPGTKQTVLTHYMLKYKNQLISEPHMANPPEGKWPSPLPAGKYLVMGDNRDNSSDSRAWGVVDISQIQGKVFMSYLSVNWNLRSFPVSEARANPIFLLWDWIIQKRSGIFIRWNRIGIRIY